MEDNFHWEESFDRLIKVGDLVIMKDGHYAGEVGEANERTKNIVLQ